MGIGDIIAVACLVFGFGFVVFFHELGHFLAAKWVGIRVEQFAIGFGHAVCAWRKGMGWRYGTTTGAYEKRIRKHVEDKGVKGGEAKDSGGKEESSPPPEQVARAAEELGLGETEYRLNWMPLGGYVKMLGQDDMDPNAQSEDPRSFNKKSIGARMLVVSAGVLMNVILAAILFMVVFVVGFHVAPPVVGMVETGSPAQLAKAVQGGLADGLRVGDRVLYLNGEYQHDFTKLFLNVALVPAGQDVPIVVERRGKEIELKVRPRPAINGAGTFYSLGIGHGAMAELRGLDVKLLGKVKKADESELDPKSEILPGDVITAVAGKAVDAKTDYPALDDCVQHSGGEPVKLRVRDAKGVERDVMAPVRFGPFFGDTPMNLGGLQPRMEVAGVEPDSPAAGKLRQGDLIAEVRIDGELKVAPSVEEFIDLMNEASKKKAKVGLVVERQGKRETVEDLSASYRTGRGKRGLGIQIGLDEGRPVVSGALKDSAAARAGMGRGTTILTIDGEAVKNWFDIHRLLKKGSGKSVITHMPRSELQGADQKPMEATLSLSEGERKALAEVRYSHELLLKERIDVRKTRNPLTAAAWGVTETRDLLLQFYVTLRRLFQGSVSTSNLMGPIGIVHAGSLFAFKGTDWLIWFLAMISANLAVVNFLPIPIVDGGLFTFLIIEKIAGKPLSPRVQTAAQLVGLAIILSVFLLVTYQDIARLWM